MGQISGQMTIDIVSELVRNNPKITRAELVKETGKSPSYITIKKMGKKDLAISGRNGNFAA